MDKTSSMDIYWVSNPALSTETVEYDDWNPAEE